MIHGVPRPCLACGKLTHFGSRCESCSGERERRRSRERGQRHYTWEYRVRAKAVREAADACWICGEGARLNDPWTADHLIPGDASPGAVLLPAHRSCNSRRGARPVGDGGRDPGWAENSA